MFMFYIFLAVLSLLNEGATGETTVVKFIEKNACHWMDRLSYGCTSASSDAVSLTECARSCSDNCVGVSTDKHGTCYHHSQCAVSTVDTCGPYDAVFQMFAKSYPCNGHGVWVDSDARCACNGGWVGYFCERLAVSCLELTSYGYALKVHVVQLQPAASSPPITVQCALWSSAEASTYVLSNTGDQDFNKTWEEYLNGFYINARNFWIGLNNIKLLNDNGLTDFKLSTSIIASPGDVYTSYGYRYSNFKLWNEMTNYIFKFDTATTNGPSTIYYGDCLSSISDNPFSTWDNNHISPGNCPAVAGNGWWFGSCNLTCNPLGSRPVWKMEGLDLKNAHDVEILGYFVSRNYYYNF